MRIAVAMSGGFSSSLVAAMMKRMGYDVVGITAQFLHPEEIDEAKWNDETCCSPESIIAAKRIAKQYEFPHKTLHLEEEYSEKVIDYFCYEYLKGRTPSPCIVSNNKIKFKRIIEYAKTMGCEKLATGYYARLKTDNNKYCIASGIDRKNDQSYYLSMLSQKILEYLALPLGEYHNTAFERMARQLDLPEALSEIRPDICFVPDVDYHAFIEQRTGIIPPPGDIIDANGKKIGEHKGIHRFTIGQRKGLGVSGKSLLYVTDIDAKKNIIVAGQKGELFRKGLFATDINYMWDTSLNGIEAFVKIHSSHEAARAKLETDDNGVYVYFDEPQMIVTPGQAAAFYNRDGNIIAGAWIAKGLP